MADPLVVELLGDPVAKERARRSPSGHFYTPKKTAAYERSLHYAVREAMGRSPRLRGAVSMSVVASLPIPPSWNLAQRTKARMGKIHPTGRPDIDNIFKAAADACKAAAFDDDSQVVFIMIRKRYSDRPGLRIEIASMREGE